MAGNVQRGFTVFIAWALQLALAYCAPLAILLILSGLLHAPDSIMWQILDYAVVWLLSVAIAVSLAESIPSSVEEGRWVWAMPVALLVYSVVWDMFLGRFDSAKLALVGRGEAGWIFTLITLPAWGCCWYSATMAWRRRRRNRALMRTGNEPRLPETKPA